MPSKPITGAYDAESSGAQEVHNPNSGIIKNNRSDLLPLLLMSLPVSPDDVFRVNEHNFNELALGIFQHQARENEVYASYLDLLGIKPESIRHTEDIPHLHVEFFKTHAIRTGNWPLDDTKYFESSSTTGTGTSKHFYNDLTWYNRSFLSTFQKFYGNPGDWCIIALLPGYLERSNSSLIRMVDSLVSATGNAYSGFYLYEHEKLIDTLRKTEEMSQKTLLVGVSFALLDVAEKYKTNFNHLTILETGGMKGRRKEMIRSELHQQIRSGFGNLPIHSEYGMTELFSQAYSTDGIHFRTPAWMRVSTQKLDDPLTPASHGRNGLIKVIDLANIQTCSFIATADIGKTYEDGSFEVLGRFDHSEQRGCNLLLA